MRTRKPKHLQPVRTLYHASKYYLDRPDKPVDPRLTRALMEWFVAQVEKGQRPRLKGPDISKMVDDAALLRGVDEARRRIAEALGMEPEAVTRNHQRHRKPAKELAREKAELAERIERLRKIRASSKHG